MTSLLVSDAVELVRKNLDELDPNGSIMLDGVNENGSLDKYADNQSMDDIIARNLPEAINAVHQAAPVQLLEGLDTKKKGAEKVDWGEWDTNKYDDEGVLHIELDSNDTVPPFLRLVAFQTVDSPIVVTDVIPEASPEGRKQLNPYIRGRADRPRLVRLQAPGEPASFNYYSLLEKTIEKEKEDSPHKDVISLVKQFIYIPEQRYSEQATAYSISSRLRQNIIDYLTAMMLETYSDQRAQFFYQKAGNYIL